MMQIHEWFAMGGYSLYVWPAYGLVALVLLGTSLAVKLRAARIRKTLRQRLKRAPA